MRRSSLVEIATPAVMSVLLFATLAATGPSEEDGPAAKPTASPPEATALSVPGFRELRTEDVQKELELTDEQKEDLGRIGQKYYQEMRRDWVGFRGTSAEERKKKYAEIRQKNVKRMKAIRAQVENVLTPDQLDRLKQINLRTQVLANPRILDQLGIDEAQRDRLHQIREQMQGKLRKLHQETLQATLRVLTPQQRKKLDELTAEGAGFLGLP